MNYMSEAGSFHDFDNTKNQDAVMCKKNRNYCVMVLADGVSACSKSGRGASIACDAVAEYLLRNSERFFEMQQHETSEHLISHILTKLKDEAAKNGFALEEYSSTVACILYNRNTGKMLYFSLGDSMIMATKADGCSVVAMPGDSRNGCCVTTTNNASLMAKVGVVDTEQINSVMICSDGAWHLMYNRNRMYQSVKQVLIEQDYAKLKEVLKNQERFDDCSFISVDLKKLQRRSIS